MDNGLEVWTDAAANDPTMPAVFTTVPADESEVAVR